MNGAIFQLRNLDTEPIERVEVDENTVRYNNIRVLDEGVWTDEGSETATLYDVEGMKNLYPEYDESEHDGPPLNIMHDIDMENGEVNEASVGGYVDPDSIKAGDDGLYQDWVLDTSTGAGKFADENLQSALESGGKVGLGGPSIEIGKGVELENIDHPRAEERVAGGPVTGTALVDRPASKTTSFDRQTATRQIAMSDGNSQTDKPLYLKRRIWPT